MWEENISTQNPTEAKWLSFKSRLKQIANNRRQLAQTYDDSSLEHLSASAEELDRWAYNTNNEQLSKEYKKQSQLASVAAMIKYAWQKSGQDWSNLRTVSDICNTYFANNQDQVQLVKDFVNSDRDPEEFGIEMWWIESDIEDNMNLLEKIFLTDWRDLEWWGWDMARWVKAAWDMFWQWISDFIWAAEKSTWAEWASETRALNEYAYKKYGKYIQNMNEDEIARLDLDLQLENIKNGSYVMWGWLDSRVTWDWTSAYQDEIDRQRYDVWAIEAWWWAFLAWLSMAYPEATALFSAWWATPYLNLPLELLQMGWYQIWNLAEFVPWLNTWLNSLPEDVQEELKNLAWNMVLWAMMAKMLKSWRPKIKSKFNVRELLWKVNMGKIFSMLKSAVDEYWNINSELFKPFEKLTPNKETLSEWWELIKNKGKSVYNWGKEKVQWPDWDTPVEPVIDEAWIAKVWEEMNKVAWKITQDKYWRWEKSNNALNLLSKEEKRNIKWNKDLIDSLEKKRDDVIPLEDRLLELDKDTRITKEEINSEWNDKNLELEWSEWTYSTKFWYDPIEAAMKAVRNMLETDEWQQFRNADWAAVENLWKKYNSEWLSPLEVAQLARYISKIFKLYKPRWQWKYETVTSKDVWEIRWDLKKISRDRVSLEVPWVENALAELDSYYSDLSNALENSYAFNNKIWEDSLKRQPQTSLQKLISSNSSKSGIISTIKNFFLKDKPYTPESLDADIPNLLRLHDNYYESIGRPWYENFSNIEKAVADAEKAYSDLQNWIKAKDTNIKPSEWWANTAELDNLTKELEQKYDNALENVVRALWVDESLVKTVAPELKPLFILKESWKRVNRLWQDVLAKHRSKTKKTKVENQPWLL